MKKIILLGWGIAALLLLNAASLWAQPTSTFTPTLSITPTPCATSGIWGEFSTGAGSVSLTGTLFQKYTLSQPVQPNLLLTNLQSVSGGTSIRMGIYNDGGTYPSNLIYQSQLQTASNGTNLFNINGDNVRLNPGNYWLALDVVGSASVTGGGGVTPDMTFLLGYDMPNPFPAALNPTVSTVIQLYLSAYVNNCGGYYATTTPLPTNVPTLTFTPTPTPSPSIPTLTPSPTPVGWMQFEDWEGPYTNGNMWTAFSPCVAPNYVCNPFSSLASMTTCYDSTPGDPHQGTYCLKTTINWTAAGGQAQMAPDSAYGGDYGYPISITYAAPASVSIWLKTSAPVSFYLYFQDTANSASSSPLHTTYYQNGTGSNYALFIPTSDTWTNFTLPLTPGTTDWSTDPTTMSWGSILDIGTVFQGPPSGSFPQNTTVYMDDYHFIDYPVPTFTPTFTPTPTGTPVTIVQIYNNPAPACAGAFGCSVAYVDACRQLNLDFTTSYIIMRLGATCGCQPSDIMALRLTGMGWDEICQHYGLDWATFVTDLQTRIETLQPEYITLNQVLRGASYDPNQFPIEYPSPMPDTLPQNGPTTEVSSLCP